MKLPPHAMAGVLAGVLAADPGGPIRRRAYPPKPKHRDQKKRAKDKAAKAARKRNRR